MRPRTTGILLVVALLLGAFLYVLEIRDDDARSLAAADEEEVFPGLDPLAVEWIELTTRDDHFVRAERSADGWRLAEPGPFAADDGTVSGVASQLAALTIAGSVQGETPLEDFGLGADAAALRFEAGGVVRTLRVGDTTPIGSNTYVMADPGGEVVYVSTWRTNALAKRLDELRDRRVIAFDHATVDAIDVAWPGGGISLSRTAQGWHLRRPVDEEADRTTVETLLSDLAFLSAEGFVDDPAELDGAGGLDAPSASIRLAGAAPSGERFARSVDFGDVYEDDRIVRGPEGTVFRVAPERLDDIPRDVLAYRFKSLGDFDVADARGVSLRLEGPGEPTDLEATLASGHWRTLSQDVSDPRIRDIVVALSRLEASEIVAEAMGDAELRALGLAPGRVRARVTGESGEVLAEVLLGRADPGTDRLAMRSDSPIVYRVDATSVSALPTDAADFDARFVGSDPDLADEPLETMLDDDADEESEADPDERAPPITP